MSRLTDRIEAWRNVARSRRASGANPLMSRTTIWLDGRRALHGDTAIALHASGEVAAALTAIEKLAPTPAVPGLHALRVVVGTPFARYHALQWQPMPRPQDWLPAARLQAIRTGAGTEAWRYAVSDGAWGAGRLAVAMPEALCAGIEQMCKRRRLRLSGIEPGYTFALRRHARRIRDGVIAIVELEEGAQDWTIAHVGLRRGGGWAGFIALPVSGSLDDVLRDAFSLCAETPPERRYVIGPGEPARWSPDAAAFEWLPAPWETAP